MKTPTPSHGDFFPPELTLLLDTAREVIDQHVGDDGNCAECGAAWPCQRVQLADFALAAL